MTATLPFPTRYLAAIGVLALLAGAFLVARPLLMGNDSSSTTSPVTASPTAVTPKPTAAAPQASAVKLLPGLPRTVAAKLRRDKVVVVTIYSGTAAADRATVGVARSGARATGAGFAAMNVLDETRAREVSSLFGTVDVPAVAVVRRPGTVVTLLTGPVDKAIVEQAAHNAGARK